MEAGLVGGGQRGVRSIPKSWLELSLPIQPQTEDKGQSFMSAALDSVSHLRVDLRSGQQEEKAPFFYLSNQNLPCHVEKPLLCALCPPGEVSLSVRGRAADNP